MFYWYDLIRFDLIHYRSFEANGNCRSTVFIAVNCFYLTVLYQYGTTRRKYATYSLGDAEYVTWKPLILYAHDMCVCVYRT